MRRAADTGFVVDQVDKVSAGAGGHRLVHHRRAHAVVGHAHIAGREFDASHAGQRHAAIDLHRIGAGRAADLVQQDGTGAAAERGTDTAERECAADAGQADAQVGDSLAADHLRFRLDGQ